MESILRATDPFKDLWPIFIVALLVLTYIFISNKSAAVKFLYAGVTNKERSGLSRETGDVTKRIGIAYNVFFFISLSLFVFSILIKFNIDLKGIKLNISIILGVICLWYMLKYGLIYSIGLLFKTPYETSTYLENTFLKLNLLGVVLFPLTLFIIYSEGYYFKPIAIFGVSLFLIFYLLKCYDAVKLGFTLNRFPNSYSFLYICTLEILPIMISVKTILGFSEV